MASEAVDAYRTWLGDGQLADEIARFDWSATPLGPVAQWPVCLKTAVALVVRAPAAMVLLWGPQGTMLYNDAYAVIAGARHPSALGSEVRRSWPELADFNGHVLDTVLAGGTLTYRDQPLTLQRNGVEEHTWFTLDYSPVLDGAGIPAGVLAVVVETTDKVRAEKWLSSEHDRLHQMFEQAPGFMALLRGAEHVFELVNPAYQQIVGHRPVLGMRVRDALPELETQGFNELLDEVFRSGEAFAGHAIPVMLSLTAAAAPEQRFVDVVYQPMRDEAGAVQGIFVQGADVTDRVAAEQAVQASEVRHRQILDSATDYAIIAFDIAGRVTRWNEGAHHIFGWTEADMLGQDTSRLFTPEDRAEGRMAVELRQAGDGSARHGERWYLRASGERFWAAGEMTQIRDASGTPSGFVKVLRDRTEQYQATQALQQSEERLRRAQQAGGVGTFTVDLATNLISATTEFHRIFGLDHADSMPMARLEALVIPQDTHLRSDSVTRGTATAPLDVEYRIQRANDGALRWIARKAEYECDASGKPLRMVGAVQDITDRKASQRAIEESAAQFHTFAQALPNHVWTSPPDGLLDWFNDRVYDYSGKAPGELHGTAWAAIVHPDDVERAASLWTASLASGRDYEVEFRIRRADGAFRWHLVRGVPIRTAGGGITRWVGTNTDIHERKLAEVESTRDRNRIWALSQEVMLICDFCGVISAANPAATRLLGWREDELIGQPPGAYLHAGDVAGTMAELDKLARGATTLAFENRCRAKDGAHVLLAWTANHVGDVLYLVGRNITEQRAVEDALRQSQKMEAVGQLTGGIAHDFNNLLQGITGSLGLVQKRMAQARHADVDRYVNDALNGARRAAALTHRLLAFSRRQPLDPRPVDANPLVASMEDLLHRTLGERVTLSMRLAPDLWTTQCDPNQLENAILNLAINSRDAMPDGGILTIETANASIDNQRIARQQGIQLGPYVCISVSDTGAGMSADTVSKAFEPFFTTKPLGQGTGLGLSMIYGFARQSEGYAKIYSEVGKGTTLRLYLPKYVPKSVSDGSGAQPAEPANAEVSAEPRAGAQDKVLVVEDEPVVRALIVEVLGELGYAALQAVDGPSGLAILQSGQPIDLLITDVGLPGLNGRQLADAARLTRPDLKILFMTGYAENAIVASGFLEPGMALITKPFAMEAFAARVREVIGL